MSQEHYYPCPECQVGALRPRRVSFFTSHDGHPIIVPDFPAWVCDVCGRREYDSSALAELHAVLDSDHQARRRHHAQAGSGQETPPGTPADARR